MCICQQGEIGKFAVMNPWFCLESRVRLVDWRVMKVLFRGTGSRLAFDSASRFAGVGVEEHCQPGDGLLIVFAPPAHVTYPGGKIGDGDQLISKPRKIGEVANVHNSCCALIAWKG